MIQHYSERTLQRLMGDDATDNELLEMWADRHPRDRKALPENVPREDLGQGYPLELFDFQLWGAKVRSQAGQLTGIMDGIAICTENDLVMPKWLAERSLEYLSYLTQPEENGRFQKVRYRLREERTRLGTLQRASLLHQICWAHRLRAKNDGHGFEFLDVKFPGKVLQAAESHVLDLYPKKMSQENAAEIAAIWLEGTWAEGKASSILQDYKLARSKLRRTLCVKELNDKQQDFFAFEFSQVRADTLSLLGCPRIV